ncbi:anaphase-promoting complex subunit 1-like isoform X2 [Actinidia eriantha]|uniref:anaphase-promoting complex subunit 1-like isoform X2 n=1 Tax=Actinidia eriantha TaxID=165200 RepID=UPI002582AB18|nr:anaphase-promoting complex subunit 1-like isoform X2 [Actinidia eriantha]
MKPPHNRRIDDCLLNIVKIGTISLSLFVRFLQHQSLCKQVNLDPNIRNIPELKSWPEFHNAVAAGLKLAPLQGKMSRTWIVYNKSEEPNAIHAGLLLALGLHGHLGVLTITDIYQYYSQEHESTTVGLMLGLATSYRGTMQPAISKAEIGRRSGGDNVLKREGYVVSAGFSLGLVALGRGEDALGFMDTFVERLFQYVGGKETQYIYAVGDCFCANIFFSLLYSAIVTYIGANSYWCFHIFFVFDTL